MMKMRIAIPCVAMGAAACLTLGALAAPKPKIESKKIREFVKYLSSDALKGAVRVKKAATRRRIGLRSSSNRLD